MDSFSLEPQWASMHVGETVTLLVQPAIRDESNMKHLLLTSVGRQFLCLQGELPDAVAYTLIDAVIADLTGGVRLALNEGSKVLCHQIPTHQIFHNAAETCAGLGLLGHGLKANGMTIQVSNELREPLIAMQIRQGKQHFVQGDIHDPHTLAKMHAVCPDSCLLAAGFSCQPWSKLGDGKKMDDQRSDTLEGVLKAGFLLRSWGILLECVTETGVDKNVQQILDAFCKLTHYRCSTVNLKLEHLMPARRHRWWCLLLSPVLPPVHLRPFPRLIPDPVLADLFPVMPDWPADQLAQIQLSAFEEAKYEECGGLAKNFVVPTQPTKTALHGWANQLQECPCTCRKYPLSNERLKTRGLHGAVVKLTGTMNTTKGVLPCARHLHPYEIAALHGVQPNQLWEPLRLAICGLGQMASPLHSGWVCAQLMEVVAEFGMHEAKSPEAVIHAQIMSVMKQVADDHPKLSIHPRFQDVAARLDKCLGASCLTHLGPNRVLRPLKDDDETPCLAVGPLANVPACSDAVLPFVQIPGISCPQTEPLAVEDVDPSLLFFPKELRLSLFQANPGATPLSGPGPSHDDVTPPLHADPGTVTSRPGPSHVECTGTSDVVESDPGVQTNFADCEATQIEPVEVGPASAVDTTGGLGAFRRKRSHEGAFPSSCRVETCDVQDVKKPKLTPSMEIAIGTDTGDDRILDVAGSHDPFHAVANSGKVAPIAIAEQQHQEVPSSCASAPPSHDVPVAPFHADPVGPPEVTGPSHNSGGGFEEEAQVDADHDEESDLENPGLTQHIAADIDAIEASIGKSTVGLAEAPVVTHAIQVIDDDDAIKPSIVEVPIDATVGSLTVAHGFEPSLNTPSTCFMYNALPKSASP